MFEPPEKNTMKQTPRLPQTRLLNGALLVYVYVIVGVPITIGCFMAYLTVFWQNDYKIADLVFINDKFMERRNSPSMNVALNFVKQNILK